MKGVHLAACHSRLALLLTLLTLSLAILMPMSGLADDANSAWRVDMTIDRSSLPGWVTHPEVTVILPVENATKVYAWGDDEVLAVHHDADTGEARITTDAHQVTWAIVGPSVVSEDIGQPVFATLYDDRAWVFSVTFDDGHHTVATHAKPEFEHYGYDAAVAVIGLWMEPEADPNAYGFCSRSEIADLWQSDWGIFNHSYSHSNAPSDITLEDAEQCQVLLEDVLSGQRPFVFTAPHVSTLWLDVIDNNMDSLGLRVLQLYADDGERMMTVDDPVVLDEQEAYHMARKDIKQWQVDLYNYADQAHEHIPQHAWVSLHGHNVAYDEDWYAVSDALAYVYTNYGLAGSNEVWVAPVDRVIEYLVTRSSAQIDAQAPVSLDHDHLMGEPQPASERLILRHGTEGQAAWDDTTIKSWFPDETFVDDAVLEMRGGFGETAILIKPPLPDLGDVDVLRVTLSLMARSTSNSGDLDLSAMVMHRSWDATTATWNQAADGEMWTGAGALGDFSIEPLDVTHTGASDLAMRSYSFDVTDQMISWLADPETYHGLLVRPGEGVSKQILFASCQEIMYPAERPALVIEYQARVPASHLAEPTATPTATCTSTPVSPTVPAPGNNVNLPLIML